MKLRFTATLLLLFFMTVLSCYAARENGMTEIKNMVEVFNKRLEKAEPPDGFFMVVQNKEDGKVNSFGIHYFTYTHRSKKLGYVLDATSPNGSGHYFVSVLENGKMLKIVYTEGELVAVYMARIADNVLQVFDENEKLLFPSTSTSAEKTTGGRSKSEETGALAVCDVMPKPAFDLGAYLSENLHYPEQARLRNKEGQVNVRFVVNEDGTISDAEVMKGFYDECDEEALRVTRNMPNWIPGSQKGKKVKVYFMLPLKFKLTD